MEQEHMSIPNLLAALETLGLLQTREVLLHEYKTFYGSTDAEADQPGAGHGQLAAGNTTSVLNSANASGGLPTSSTGGHREGRLDLEALMERGPGQQEAFVAQSVPWGDTVNEYENHDDVGYQRTDVGGQQQFLDTEVDTTSGTPHGTSHTAPTSCSEFAEDSDSTCGSSISGAVIDLNPSTSGRMTAPPASPSEGAPLFGRSPLDLAFPSTGDTAWDLGPVGIRIADPVTTPTKSSTAACDEPKPVLSRVESLSSSFKDFDIECNDDDLPSRRVSSAQDAPGAAQADSAAEVIDFHPSPPPSPPPEAETNSGSIFPTDLTPPPPVLLSPATLLDPIVLAPPASPVSQEAKPADSDPFKERDSKTSIRFAEPRENVGGGFSFPVATPTDTQPDHHLFKSWPSVRSSCTSEVIGPSDDDHVAADYADDEYLRSVSKPSSRSASQNLGDLTKVCLRQNSGDDDQQSGLEGWSFAQPIPTSGTSSHRHLEPHLSVSPASPPKPDQPHTSTSCISEPSTTTSYNTCMPAGLLETVLSTSPNLGSSTSTPQLSVESPALAQSSKPSSVKGGLSLQPVRKSGSQSGSGLCSPKGVKVVASDGKALATHPLALGSAKGSRGTTDDSVTLGGAVAALPVALQVSNTNTSEHLSEELVSGEADDEGDDDEGQSLASTGGEGGEDEEDDMDSAVDAAAGLDWQQLQVSTAESGGVMTPPGSPGPEDIQAPYTINDDNSVTYHYDPDFISTKYEVFDLKVYHRRGRTGFEETKDFPIRMNELIAGRYQVVDFLGSAAFSRAVQALDIKTGMLVCLKIIKNNKDYLDQSLDEIKLLKYVNDRDPDDRFGIVRLYDFFYYKEHLFLVCELLRANLYEFQKYNRENGDAPYFTNGKIQRIAYQVLRSLCYLHHLHLIHSDLKPENILIKSYSKCEVKVIDLGSSCFVTDQLSSYVQSRSYRAPEVILGLPYDQKVDIWSLGCILAELSSGQVLFQNDSLPTLLARLEGILGPVPQWMIRKGRYANRFYTRSGQLYEKNSATERYEILTPKRTSLRHRVPDADEHMLSFIAFLLQIDPHKRPTAQQALQHPWLYMEYPE